MSGLPENSASLSICSAHAAGDKGFLRKRGALVITAEEVAFAEVINRLRIYLSVTPAVDLEK